MIMFPEIEGGDTAKKIGGTWRIKFENPWPTQ
jgi:hypothetical protein